MTSRSTPTVLVVDDEETFIELYSQWLQDSYSVKTAMSGAEALEKLDADVDITLLDRRMSGMTGDEVLDNIRERGFDCRIALITAVEPDIDIVDMPFDAYLVKPITREEIRELVDNLLTLREYDSLLTDYFALASKLGALRGAVEESALASNTEYQSLESRFRVLQRDLDATLNDLMNSDQFRAVIRELTGNDTE